MLKKLRIAFAILFFTGITLLFLDSSGVLQPWLGWMAKLQFLPACLALNVAVIIGLVLLTLAFGRVYCSVICPLGVFQDGVSKLGTIKKRHPYKYKKEIKWLRYGVFALFVIALIAGVQSFVAILAPYSAYGRMVSAVLHHNSVPVLIVAGVTLIVVVVLAFRGGRTYCNTICPVGTALSFLARFAAFRPVIDAEKCRNCRICEHKCKAQCIDIDNHKIDYSRCVDCFDCLDNCKFDALKYKFAWGKTVSSTESDKTFSTFSGEKVLVRGVRNSFSESDNEKFSQGRRAFITGTAVVAGTALLKAQEKKVDGGFAEVLPKAVPERDVPLTPPGSRSVKDFYRRCTACQLCVSECPNGVLRPSADLEHLMQPEMGFEKGFCRPECTRCSQLCPAGAIKPIGKEEKTAYHVGTARVNLDACLSLKGVHCGNCATKCPTGAITMVETERGLTPVVAEQICIGCGACEYLCPVRPISAITVNGREEHIL
ncbi:MAG: 4Fe-4S dicluster domain-containing protein [Bacteroidales bacterium]|nr:4Fe-4S dicluster domain-containing protein [Bacteroidales bacterium]